jgi:ferredoxin-NADP reductase
MLKVRVIDNQPASEDAFVLCLEKPGGFSFLPGQFVVLQLEVNGKPLRRSYSIASAPHQDCLHIAVRLQPQGRFSPALKALVSGDEVGLLGPFGLFTLPEDDSPLVLLAAGTGITPFISFLKHLKHAKDERSVSLLYSNQTPTRALYYEELSSPWPFTKIKHTLTKPPDDWNGLKGRIDAEKLTEVLTPKAHYYVCGPTPMVVAVKQSLIELGVAPDRIHTEKFGHINA